MEPDDPQGLGDEETILYNQIKEVVTRRGSCPEPVSVVGWPQAKVKRICCCLLSRGVVVRMDYGLIPWWKLLEHQQ